MNSKIGTLYIVATPIGNLSDMTPRAVDISSSVSLILAEDTRQGARLTSHYGISTPLQACHEHNEQGLVSRILDRLGKGDDIALISDAGTPLISDPGYRLVKAAREQQIPVSPIPGPCAFVAALSVSGLPTDRFWFEGFLPSRGPKRQTRIEALKNLGVTLVFYESSHRITDCLADFKNILGEATRICVGREITKKFESFYAGTAADVLDQILVAPEHRKGEFVVIVAPPNPAGTALNQACDLARRLAADLPAKKSATIAAETFGVSRNECYRAIVGER